MVYLSNKKIFSLPSSVQKKVKEGFRIYAAEGNGYDVLVPVAPATYRGEMTAYYAGNSKPHTLYYYGTGTAGKSAIAPLPENSVVYIKADQTEKKQPTEELLQSPNVVNADGVAQQLTINGDKPFFIPSEFTADSLTFTKNGDGYQTLMLPFDTQAGLGIVNGDGSVDALPDGIAAAGQPVLFQGNVSIKESGRKVNAGTFDVTENGYIFDGTSFVYAENISPFTYVWDEPNGSENVNVNDNANKGEEAVYDLSGRKVISKLSTLNSQLNKGIYIINGKKILIK